MQLSIHQDSEPAFPSDPLFQVQLLELKTHDIHSNTIYTDTPLLTLKQCLSFNYPVGHLS